MLATDVAASMVCRGSPSVLRAVLRADEVPTFTIIIRHKRAESRLFGANRCRAGWRELVADRSRAAR